MKKFLILFLFSVLFVFSQNAFADEIEYIHKTPNVHIFKLDTKKIGCNIKPYVVSGLDTVKNVYENNEFDFVVNGGYFDPQTGAPVSYVTINGEIVENPYDNASLLEKFSDEEMDQIADRAELRIMENKRGKLRFDITNHKAYAPNGWTVKHALQAGPQVYPVLNLEKEFFVSYDENGKIIKDSIDAFKKRPRTVVGIKGDFLYVIVFTKQAGYTLDDIHKFCAGLKLDKAMNLDGGGSTAINYDDVEVYSEEKSGRKVKSFLVVED